MAQDWHAFGHPGDREAAALANPGSSDFNGNISFHLWTPAFAGVTL